MWQSGQESCLSLMLCHPGHVFNLSEPLFYHHAVKVNQEDKSLLKAHLLKKSSSATLFSCKPRPRSPMPPGISIIYFFPVYYLTAP